MVQTGLMPVVYELTFYPGFSGTSKYADNLMLINRWFPKSYPNLDWIQVEVSSYCNAGCIYCPHTAYKKTGRTDTFRWKHSPI
jgi:hypothetical protein